MIRIGVFISCLLLAAPLYGGAQIIDVKTEADSLTALSNTIVLYQDRVKDNSLLYNGREYVGFSPRIAGHAFLETKDWQTASLVYYGRLYEGVPLLYDLVSDELVVKHYNSFFRLKLVSNQVVGFRLQNRNFIRIEGGKGVPLATGFYEQLYKGRVEVLAKRRKSIFESHIDGKIHSEFVHKNQYYLYKEGQYYPISKMASVLKVLKNEKKEIQRMMKKNGVIYWKNPEDALVKIATFYDQATQNP